MFYAIVGGGIHKLDDAKKIFELGVEKICINSSLFRNINLIKISGKYMENNQ